MAINRWQIVSVGMWRGRIKRWNTTLHLEAGSTAVQDVFNLFARCGWKNPGDVDGDCSGGIAEIKVYGPGGGAPISSTVYFDWQVPAEWIAYGGQVWDSVDVDTPLDASGESALVVTGRLPGLSATGKPVYTRKFLHAIPSRTATDYSDPDISVGDAGRIEAEWDPAFLTSPSGIVPVEVVVERYYGNHQRVRGRRRTVAQVASQAFAGGVVVGAGGATSGNGPRFLVE